MYIFLKSINAHAHQQVIFIYEVLLYTNKEVLGTFQSLKIDVPRVFMGSLSLFNNLHWVGRKSKNWKPNQ